MRLNQTYINAFVTVLNQYIAENLSVDLRLYGSRVDDNSRGGDIDLLLLVEDKNLLNLLKEKKWDMLAAIKISIGEQKVDLAIHAFSEVEKDSFLKIIYPQSILLHRWAF